MKQVFSALLISFVLFSCSKSSNEDQKDQTSVKFINILPRSFNNVVIGSWNGTGQAKLIKNAGTLGANSSTAEIPITDNTVATVYFCYDETNGKTYITSLGFPIAQGIVNNWQIDGNLSFTEISKNDQLYPK